MDINSILDLSHLNIKDERKTEFSNQIEKILDYMSVLENVKEAADPNFNGRFIKTLLIVKTIHKSFSHELVEKNAPDFKDGGFSVPRIV